MNEISCEVCMDLIPLVWDGAVSKESKRAVERHLEDCAACRELAQYGKIPATNEDQALSKAVKRVQKMAAAVMALLVIMGICLFELVMRGSSLVFLVAVLMLRWLYTVVTGRGGGWKHRLKQILGIAASILLILGLAAGCNAITGNPVSRMLAEKAAENYLAGRFPDSGNIITQIQYDSKRGHYQAEVSAPGSVDGYFTVDIDGAGNFHHDTYDNVLTGRNTANRLEEEYREKAEPALLRLNLNYRAMISCRLEFEWKPYQGDAGNPQYFLDGEPLVPDGAYDTSALGEQIGVLRVTVETENVSWETVAEVLLETKRLMEEAEVPFRSVDLTLQYPWEEPLGRPEGSITVSGILCRDIYEEGLSERLRQAGGNASAPD